MFFFVLFLTELDRSLAPTPFDNEILDLADELRMDVLVDIAKVVTALWGLARPPPRWGPRTQGPQGPYAEQVVHVDAFLRAFKESRGDVAATVKELRLESRMYWRGRPSL